MLTSWWLFSVGVSVTKKEKKFIIDGVRGSLLCAGSAGLWDIALTSSKLVFKLQSSNCKNQRESRESSMKF